ncbi:hypothetical protein APR41_12065 [Salegentibacter salinarum]|uniref:Glycosyltransferase 2-like domain-containing protein n=1 Tax=Salegentibacter salinarum TaxID=447422 RepID=A0A2N0U2C2_9FLAO|nr:glycosyltransferase family 2 protein [Salegentibacter salinarum]PKD21144.1 hypothetical protein APR41_12065 [Salegentibacter salinarum]SKB76407.1 Glycosyltransferase involved in cell wall bisynthesis [Salegentibacter salinarum]
MTKELPLISIVMATYNRAHLIKESLIAISEQSYQNWECLIIDDGSKDKTQEIVEKFGNKDLRFKYSKRGSNHKKGLPGSRNHGISLIKGEYIIFFDDDDIPHPDCLKWSIEEILNYKADYCRFLRSVFFQDLNKNFNRLRDYAIIQHTPLNVNEMITGDVPFNSCQVLWKSECFNNEIFNEALMFAEEWELYTRILLKEPKGITIKKPLYFGRKHAVSNTGEFRKADISRVDSKIYAARLIVAHLSQVSTLSSRMTNFFIRMGFNLKSYNLIKEVLNNSNLNFLEKFKYRLGFAIYPLIKPILRLKGSVIK